MRIPCPLLVFTLDRQYALRLGSVERIVQAAEVTPLPQSLDMVLGVIDAQGSILPVFDIRRRFRLPHRAMELTDLMIIATTKRRRVVLLVDSVTGVVECAEDDVIGVEEIVPQTELIDGVTKLGDDILLIHNLDKFLSVDEERALDDALKPVR